MTKKKKKCYLSVIGLGKKFKVMQNTQRGCFGFIFLSITSRALPCLLPEAAQMNFLYSEKAGAITISYFNSATAHSSHTKGHNVVTLLL